MEVKINLINKKNLIYLLDVQFIGELFLTKVVPLKVINICSNILLKNFINHYQFSLIDSNSNTTKEYEIDIEAIITLFEKGNLLININFNLKKLEKMLKKKKQKKIKKKIIQKKKLL